MQATTKRIQRTALALFVGASVLSGAGCSDSPTQAKGVGAKVQLTVNNASGSAILLDQHKVSLQTGYGTIIEAKITDAAGATITSARPAWSTTQAMVATLAVLPDSGVATDGARASVGARNPGEALIIASYDGVADTVTVTVEQGAGVPGPGPWQPPAKFTITARATGFTGGPDSSKSVFTPVPGTVVTFVQMPKLAGDTIQTSAPQVLVPTVRGTANTDAQGMVTFTDMPGARFRLDMKTPDGSDWASRTFDGFFPYYSPIRVDVLLQKK